MQRRLVLAFCLATCFGLMGRFVYAMTSTNFIVNWDSVNSGGNDTSTSPNYQLRDTVGEIGTGDSSSTNFGLSAGYRTGDADPISLTLSLATQENATQVAFTAFSAAGKTVTVSSATGFSVGDTIGVAENSGASQLIAVGRVTDVAGLVLTVDQWDGVPLSISAIPAGGDDYVYRMNGSAAQLGTLSATAVNTSMTATRISTTAASGYTVYVSDDDNLRVSPSQFIANVGDGSVTLGTEEYGWRVFGSSATNTGSDLAFTTGTTAIQSAAVATADDRVGLVYKVAISPTTPNGSYAHSVYYTATGNF